MARPSAKSPASAARLAEGLRLHQRGRLAEAERIYAAILAEEPVHFDALRLLGMLRRQQGRNEEALALVAAALEAKPDSVEALSNYGIILAGQGRREEALACFDKALALAPDQVNVLYNRGSVLKDLGRHAEAVETLDRVLALKPDYVEALINRGIALKNLKRHAEAVASYDRALALRPNEFTAYNNRGNALREIGRYAEALASYDKALAIKPDHVEAYNNRGVALKELERYPEALASYDRALALRPGYAEALSNRALVLHELDRSDEALASYERAIAVRSDYAEAKRNKALLCLSLGRFAEGWSLYEQRWPEGEQGPRPYPQPRWNGERVDGVLLVWGEQGLGDTILFASMVPELAGRADSVVVEVEPRLVALFARSFPGVQVVALGPLLHHGPIAAQLPMGSLGRHLRTGWETFPRREGGYLVADKARAQALRARLTSDGRAVIGLSWRSGNPKFGRHRSAPLPDFAPLLRLTGCRFVDLQYGDTAAERHALEQGTGLAVERLTDVDNKDDIDGLAALIAACDAVVTIDNTTVHLAGALGTPTWVLLPHGHARIWYWFEGRDRSLWYPSVRLRGRKRDTPWTELIAAVAGEVAAFVTQRR